MPLAITVILEHGDEVARTASHEYPRLLFTDDASFEHLSELDDCSYDIFASSDMPELIGELSRVRMDLHGDDMATSTRSSVSVNAVRHCPVPRSPLRHLNPFS